jgi:hypothetical protein
MEILMTIDDSFINSLPSNKLLAEAEIINCFFTLMNNPSIAQNKQEYYEDFIEIFGFYQVFAEKNLIDVAFPKLTLDKKINVGLIIRFFETRHKEIERDVLEFNQERILYEKKSQFKSILEDVTIFDLTEREQRILNRLIDELLDIIGDNKEISPYHTSKITKRLKSLISIMNTKVRSFDQFWALIGDGAVLLGKFKGKAKPIVDKIKEIINMVWKIQARSEDLSSDIPMMVLSFKDVDSK